MQTKHLVPVYHFSVIFGQGVFQNRVVKRIFGIENKWLEAGEDCTMSSFVTCTLHQILSG